MTLEGYAFGVAVIVIGALVGIVIASRLVSSGQILRFGRWVEDHDAAVDRVALPFSGACCIAGIVLIVYAVTR